MLDAARMAERIATAQKVAARLVAERTEYDDAEGYFLDHVVTGADGAQTDRLMDIIDAAYGR